MRFGARRLAGALAHFEFERAGVFLPAALWIPALEFRNASEGSVPLAQPVFCVRFPIESGIRLRAIQLRELIELGLRAVVAVFVERFAAFVVKFG